MSPKRLSAWILGLVCVARAAHAELPACATADVPQIALESVVDPALELNLTAELRARGFRLCRGESVPDAQIASLRIELGGDRDAVARIELSDRVTQKRVERTLDLGPLPENSRPLAIAASTDELLRASWAELTLVDAPPPAREPPPVVTRAVSSTVKPLPLGRALELGLAGTAEIQRYRTAFGARLELGYWLDPRFGLALAPAFDAGLARSSAHGRVALDAASVELGARYALTPISRELGVAVEGAVSFARLSFNAVAGPATNANSFSDWSVSSSARFRGWLGHDHVRATLSLGAIYGVRPSRAYDTDHSVVVTSDEGAGLEALAGCAIIF